jgi:cardiolipin synthase
VKHLPNLLSFARLALAPYLFLQLWRREYDSALALFVIAGLTDALDGFLARRWGTSSRLGAYLDPVADKVLLSGTFLVLALDDVIETWVAVLVLGRDILILLFAAGVFVFTKSLRDFPPSLWGKASTAVQIAFAVGLVMHFAGYASGSLVGALKWLTVALTVWSGVDYARRAVKMRR